MKLKSMEKLEMSKYSKNFFFYHTPLFLVKELYNSNQNINDEIVKHINDTLIELKTDITRKKLLKMKIQIEQLILLKKF